MRYNGSVGKACHEAVFEDVLIDEVDDDEDWFKEVYRTLLLTDRVYIHRKEDKRATVSFLDSLTKPRSSLVPRYPFTLGRPHQAPDKDTVIDCYIDHYHDGPRSDRYEDLYETRKWMKRLGKRAFIEYITTGLDPLSGP